MTGTREYDTRTTSLGPGRGICFRSANSGLCEIAGMELNKLLRLMRLSELDVLGVPTRGREWLAEGIGA